MTNMTASSNYRKAVRRRVLAGIKWLDTNEPSWLDRIDLDTLDMGDVNNCVLGQVFANNDGRISGFDYVVCEYVIDTKQLGFSVDGALAWDHDQGYLIANLYDILTTVWLQEVYAGFVTYLESICAVTD